MIFEVNFMVFLGCRYIKLRQFTIVVIFQEIFKFRHGIIIVFLILGKILSEKLDV